MFRHIQDQPPLKEAEGPIALIMAPARELAFQIFNEAKKFTKGLGLRVACIYGARLYEFTFLKTWTGLFLIVFVCVGFGYVQVVRVWRSRSRS